MSLRAILPILVLVVFPMAQAQLSKEDADREKRLQEKAAAATADTSKKYGWHHGMVAGLNLTQVSFKDWAQGGENALSYTVFVNGASVLDCETINWSNSYKLSFGQTRLGSQGLRKTDDEIYYEALLIYKFGTTVNPYVSATFRTQFAEGFTYDNNGTATGVSKFFDPEYFTQSAGVAWKPVPEVTTRIGAAVREIFTSQFTHYASDPLPAAPQKSRVEGGIESVTEVAWSFADNLTFSSRLELFAPLKSMDRVYARCENLITAKVNKYVSANFGVQFLHDLNASPRTQIKQVLAMGVSYSIL